MAFDLKKFLMDDLGMDDAEATATATKIKPEKATALAGRYQTQEELTAAAAKIEQTRQELAAANTRINEEMAEWAQLSTREKAEATELRASLEQAKVRATQLETRLTTLATQHGVDPKPLLEGAAVVAEPKKKDEPPAPDPRYVDQNNFGSAMGFALDLPANLQYISEQHFALTGERLDTREIVKTIKANAGVKGATVDPIAIWEDKYKIPEKREAKAKVDLQKQITDAEARGEERARSQAALPNASAPGRHAPVFGQRDANGAVQPRTSALQRPQPGGTVNNAVNAFRTGKYRKTA